MTTSKFQAPLSKATLAQRFLSGGSVLLLSVLTAGATWLNETGLPAEADYTVLQFPSSFSISTTVSPPIYGRIYEAGVTEVPGPSSAVLAEVGYGPPGTDPRSNNLWVWFPASFNVQSGFEDEYQGTMNFVAPGTYSYTFRFSTDNSTNYTAADLDGAGSNGGFDFSPASVGVANVTFLVVTNTFTYQGRLLSSGLASDGFFDLRFSVHDSASGGNTVAGPVTNFATLISNGLFTTVISLTNAPFNGDSRWLEVSVRSNAGGVFTSLSPRQRFTESPYASHAFTAGGLKVKGAGEGATTPVFIHRATAGNIVGSKTTIDRPLCNGDATALLIITPNYNPGGAGGTYDANPIAAAYDVAGSRWTIVNQNGAAMTLNAAFNVMIVKP
jgi:hypothetical protein